MFCKNCGCEIDEKAVCCTNCGEKLTENAASITAQNNQTASNTIYSNVPNNGTVQIKQKTLDKCAWFAPVAVVVSALICNIWSALLSCISENMDFSVYIRVNSLTSIIINLNFISLIVGLILYTISTVKIERSVKKQADISVLVPYLCSTLAAQISGSISYAAMQLIGITPTNIYIIQIIMGIVFSAIGAVLSYFLTYSFFKSISKDDVKSSENELSVQNQEFVQPYPINNYANLNNLQYVTIPPMIYPVKTKSDKTKLGAGLLCFFLGVLGIHRFYVGKIGTGLLWMFTGGLFGIGAFIDFLVIIFGGFKDSNGLELS